MRLQDFTVYVSNSSDISQHTDICAHHPGYIEGDGKVTLQCATPMVARYVSIVNSKIAKRHYYFALCEVVIEGAEATGRYKENQHQGNHLTIKEVYKIFPMSFINSTSV